MPSFVSIYFPALMIAAAAFDLGTFKIPNRMVAALMVGWPIALLVVAPPLSFVLTTLAWSGGVLAVGLFLFSRGWIGAGDIKLLAAAMLWIGAPQVTPFILKTTLAGAFFGIALLRFRRMPLPAGLVQIDWIDALHSRKRAMPYGVAIAIGALLTWPDTLFFAL